MTPAELARRLLTTMPANALCDTCLALACGTTLTEMHEITKALADDGLHFQPASTCASCRHTVATISYRSKCAHCSRPFDAGDSGLLFGGELFHVQCVRRLITDETVQVSRSLSRRSRDLIEQSRRRIRSSGAAPGLGPSA
jgi:hypothetical protein